MPPVDQKQTDRNKQPAHAAAAVVNAEANAVVVNGADLAPIVVHPTLKDMIEALIAKAVANGGNRYDAIFESVHFATPNSDRVFPSKDGLSKSKRAANVVVMLAGGFASIPGSIYVRQTGNSTTAEMTFFGTIQQNCLTPTDEASKADLLDWRRRAVEAYKLWRKDQGPAGQSRQVVTAIDASDLGISF